MVASGLVIWGYAVTLGFCCDLFDGAMLPLVGYRWCLFCFVFVLGWLLAVVVGLGG